MAGTQWTPPPSLSRPHVADTSVWSKAASHDGLRDWFNAQVRSGAILSCDVVAMELLRSERSPKEYARKSAFLHALRAVPTGLRVMRRARQVQGLLAERSQHRGIPPADLVIAASAEQANVPLLHYDRDYDRIAAVTGQECGWVLPAGTLQ